MRTNPNKTDYFPTRLIQTLKAPYDTDKAKVLANAFAFGGGGSGLTDEAQAMLDGLWSWEYMGAAEYEFGACQKALYAISEYSREGDLIGTMVEIDAPVAVASKGTFKYMVRDKKRRKKTGVFVLCHRNHLRQVETTLNGLATGNPIPKDSGHYPVDLKVGIRFWEYLYVPGYRNESFNKAIGGLELNNGWIFMYAEENFRKVCDFFGVTPDSRTFPLLDPSLETTPKSRKKESRK